ncbi:MAG TPA: transcription-repair coupling factor [Candidatus Omnitrophota bacterium]|nr:transcription-repair coupling factor [Candidatus Omnitrophota bacterium]HRY84952.1 transcription-repair coupling factor [Candidatus Omnitrophota bacterium]
MEIKRLKVNTQIGIGELEALLAELHYQKREYVALPGEFAVRGGTVDIYPVTYRLPVRIQLHGDTLAQIRDFSPASGESTAVFEEVFLIEVSDLFRKKLRRMEERLETFEPVAGTKDLERGDLVVHLKYGIGRFLGTKVIQMQKVRTRCMAIEYADREILYLSMEEPVERYIGGSGVSPKLTKLNTQEWERIKHRTRTALHKVAQDLLQIQAKRSLLKGLAFPKDTPWQREFEEEFPFEETPGQKRAIEEVKRDMESDGPMDRLLCGDVGYGKTEVAMRAAFKAVMGGKQAAFLVPTTILAEQHYILLKDRTKNFPASVGLLSRFQTPREQKAIVKALREGAMDIVIGTHRLLSKDIQFKDLGLVIIDEEQRFGVRHKEKLKQMRTQVDVLTLTATPIPRTLHMALLGVRDMSVIDTPPENRLPIETFVMEYHENIVKQAIERELVRKGQVYFVHNRVQSIERVHERLKKLLPAVRFGVMHGQMKVEMLEGVMKQFLKGEIDCLISTNIVESGIDIPNVNTLIVDRADCFGLADLYQLRGRVGRFKEKRQAFAYFLIPKNWVMTQDAQKRLHAIEKFTQLGSGFKIAMEDLEIRGTGNLLGHEQSGFIQAVGFDLYCKMLKKAVEEQKSSSSGLGTRSL